MIPKRIHYCWFGGAKKQKLAKKCLASWSRVCPDYEIVEWNESNFDVFQNEYTRYCFENKKWAFLSDFARLSIVYENGGLYFDTDVELLEKPDSLLNNSAFFGFETEEYIATGLGFGAEKGHKSVKEMMEPYLKMKPDREGNIAMKTCPALNTEALIPFGLVKNGRRQELGDILVLPPEVLNPYDDPTGRMNKTANTISIHWYGKSWMSRKAVLRSTLTKPFHRVFGTNCFEWVKKLLKVNR